MPIGDDSLWTLKRALRNPSDEMMIDIFSEYVISISQSAREWKGGEVHCSTVHRYRLSGIRGVKLECVRIGGRWHTSWQAIDRFIKRLNLESQEGHSTERVSKSAQLNQADKELDRERI